MDWRVFNYILLFTLLYSLAKDCAAVNEKPTCEERVTVTKDEHIVGGDLYCPNTSQPCRDPDSALNYTLVASRLSSLMEQQGDCLVLLSTDLTQPTYCLTVFATEVESESPQTVTFEVCIIFNSPPRFGNTSDPVVIDVNLQADIDVHIPVNAQPDSISLVEITDVVPNNFSGYFSVPDVSQPTIKFTTAMSIANNVTAVEVTVNVTDDGNPPLTSQATFSLMLVNDVITCEQSVTIYVEADTPATPAAQFTCDSAADNQLTYTANVLSGDNLEISINNNGEASINPTSEVADFFLSIDVSSIYNAKSSFNVTVSTGRKPSCDVVERNVLVMRRDEEGTVYVNFTCVTEGSDQSNIDFDIHNDTESDYFDVESDNSVDTGRVVGYAVISLDTVYTEPFPTSLTVTASNVYGSTELVFPIGVDSSPPRFLDNTTMEGDVQENVTTEHVVFVFSASDTDSTILTYSVKDAFDSDASIPFTIDSNGTLTTMSKLNASKTSSYFLAVTVSDPGKLSSRRNFTVNVIDVNEAPYCDYSGNAVTVDIEMHASVNTSVIIINCVDVDVETAFKQLTYRMGNMATQPTDVFGFNDADDRNIILLKSLENINTETTPSMSFNVVVSDEGTPPLSTTVTVTVSLSDAGPSCEVPELQYQLSEKTVVTSCFNLTHGCTDPVLGGLDFVLYDHTDESTFEQLTTYFSLATGQENSNASYVTICIYEDIEAQLGIFKANLNISNAVSTRALSVAVEVTDVNDTPVISGPTNVSVSETTPLQTTVATFAISDPDTGTNGALTFTFEATEMANAGDFVFRADSRTVEVGKALSSARQVNYTYTITVTDGGGVSTSSTLRITVESENTAPTCEDAQEFIVDATSKAGDVVGNLTCYDNDVLSQNRDIVYTVLVADIPAYITISSSGTVTLLESIPLEYDTLVYIVTVGNIGMEDNSDAVTNVTVTIVYNKNFPPSCNATSIAISFLDTDSLGCNVKKVKCTTPVGSDLSIISREGNLTERFDIRTEKEDMGISLRMCANEGYKDDIGTFVETTVITNNLGNFTMSWTVSVTDVNEPSYFQHPTYYREIREDYPPGAPFAVLMVSEGAFTDTALTTWDGLDALRVTDPDVNTDHYQITTVDTTVVSQRKDNMTVVSSTNLPVKYQNTEFSVNGTLEEWMLYIFTIQVFDGDNNVESVTYTVNVTDINEAPTCRLTELSVDVNLLTPVDTVLRRLECTDPDYEPYNTQTDYSLSGADKDYFQITADGIILTSVGLPRTKDILTFSAVARDGADNSLQHYVNITLNVNRTVTAVCNPVSTPPSVWVIASCVDIQLACMDPSADGSSSLTYTILTTGNYTTGFNVSGENGDYQLCYQLFDTNDLYVMDVEVDNGLEAVTQRVAIEVVYQRSTPKFDQQRYVGNVTDMDNVGHTVLQVTAVTEGEHSGRIIYDITTFEPKEFTSYFQVDRDTGQISLTSRVRQLVIQDVSAVVLTIQATDNLSLLKSSVSVEVTVLEVNTPLTCQQVDPVEVSIDSGLNDKVAQVLCTDPNHKTQYNTITYALEDEYFSVDSDGWVTLQTALPVLQKTHELRLVSSDGEFSAQVNLSVTVNMESRPNVKTSGLSNSSIHVSWSFARSDYVAIVERYILSYEPQGYSPQTVVIDKSMEATVLTNLLAGTSHQIILVAETQYGNITSVLLVAKTHEIPVLTWISIRYKDKTTQWSNDFTNTLSALFLDYQRTAILGLVAMFKELNGIHDMKIIGLSFGSVNVDGLVAVNQTGNMSEVARVFQDGIYLGKLGNTDVDAGSAQVFYGNSYIQIKSISLSGGEVFALKEGDNITISCPFRLVGEGLTPKVSWSLDGRRITSTSTGKFSESLTRESRDMFGYVMSLSVRHVTTQEAGSFICKVEANENSITLSESILPVVFQKPVLDLRPLTSHVQSGATVELNCTQSEGDEADIEFKWFRDGSPIDNPPVSEVSGAQQQLSIPRVQVTSDYFCQVTSKGGTTNSTTATIYIIRSDVETCAGVMDSLGTEWMPAPIGHTVRTQCPQGYRGIMNRECGGSGEWEEAVYTGCQLETLLSLQNQVETVEDGIAVASTEHLSTILQNVTSSEPLLAGDIHLSIDLMDRLATLAVTKKQVKPNIVTDLVNTGNNMLKSDLETWESLEKTSDKNSVTSLMKSLDEFGQAASLLVDSATDQENVTVISTEHIVLAYGKTFPKDIVFPWLEGSKFPVWIQESKTRVFLRNISYSPLLPAGGLIGFSALFYKDVETLLQDLADDSEQFVAEGENAVMSGKKLNSKILSFSLNPRVKSKLDPPLLLSFEHVNVNASEPVCGFLDFSSTYGRRGRWSNVGCQVINSTTNLTVCKCDHLTNFAILMSPGRVSGRDAKILSIISAVGCCVSIFFLLLTITIYICLWRYVKSDRAIILLNLCVALIIAYSIFLAGVTQTHHTDVCTGVAALLHFFFLVVFFLMLAEGVEVLVSVVYVFNTKSRLKWLLALSWVPPLAVVGISLAVTKLEGYGNKHFCWLSLESGLLWAFVAPALAVILTNLIIVIIVLKTMFSTTAMMTKSAMEKGRAGLKALCVLLPLMGVTWVFGVFSVNEDLILFQYLFAVFNSLQGFFIFIFHCLVSRQVQDGMKNRRRRYRAKSFKTTGTESSSQIPASKLNSTGDDYKFVNDLDKKVESPFLEVDRQVQQIANKLYPSKDNILVKPKNIKSTPKVKVPVDLSDIKLENKSEPDNTRLVTSPAQWLMEGHVLLSEEPSIEENDAVIIGSPSPKTKHGVPPSPKKTAWGEQPLHFSDVKSGELPPLKNPPRLTLVDHYGPPPPHVLDAASNLANTAPTDVESRLKERQDRIHEVYGAQDTPIPPERKKKPSVKKKISAHSQKSRSSAGSNGTKNESTFDEPEVETIQLFDDEMPMYMGQMEEERPHTADRRDHHPQNIAHRSHTARARTNQSHQDTDRRQRRQQKRDYMIEPPRRFVTSEEDLSRYGKRQPFGGIRTSADIGIGGMSRPRQQRDIRAHDISKQYW